MEKNQIERNSQFFGAEAREKLLSGIELVYRAVAPTLGAGGRNVVYNKWSGVPIITNDGVSIARQVKPLDNAAFQGAALIRQVCEQANAEVGDGTTTSTILAYELIVSGMRALAEDSSINPMTLRSQMLAAMDKVVASVSEMATPISTLEDLQKVARISVEDEAIGNLIGKAIFDAGKDGVVYVSEAEEEGVAVEKIDGYQFPEGMVTGYFVTDPSKGNTVLDNPIIIVTDILLTDSNESLVKVINRASSENRPILILCSEYHPQLIALLVLNLSKGALKSCVVKLPMAKSFMGDFCAVVGATPVSDSTGIRTFDMAHCGTAEKVVIAKDSTTVFSGAGKSQTESLIASLKTQLETDLDQKAKSEIQERLAKLTGSMYIVKVGGKTEAGERYLRMKVDDAVSATKAASELGILPGGGISLLNVNRSHVASNAGEKVVFGAMRAPFDRIVSNAGADPAATESLLVNESMGFNALDRQVVQNVIEAGIIDPAKVTKIAVESSVKFASLFLTTETIIVPLDTPSN
jgi:chaperonin GroEL